MRKEGHQHFYPFTPQASQLFATVLPRPQLCPFNVRGAHLFTIGNDFRPQSLHLSILGRFSTLDTLLL